MPKLTNFNQLEEVRKLCCSRCQQTMAPKWLSKLVRCPSASYSRILAQMKSHTFKVNCEDRIQENLIYIYGFAEIRYRELFYLVNHFLFLGFTESSAIIHMLRRYPSGTRSLTLSRLWKALPLISSMLNSFVWSFSLYLRRYSRRSIASAGKLS